ncbi:Transcriptional regulator [Stigmatella aurantiaca DW4/3-1]|uniref:Transcriptional regulator n=1 Tax=Stigmatella aurantiaca (strain DW4/3-1) TaxID=378806 RepID=E3FKG2_STIAD|nr:Transcriptional regulator [Stigmatella aurantiaca DW4/3-1]
MAEEARWDDNPSRWAELEFELLRQAARALDRPGQALLLQSLERSYRGMARRLRPHLNGQATRQWALCVLHALTAKDAQALRGELPALLQASDAHLLASLPPPQEPPGSSRSPLCADTTPSHPTPEHEKTPERLSEAKGPNLSACPTGSSQRTPTGGPPSEAPFSDSHTPLLGQAERAASSWMERRRTNQVERVRLFLEARTLASLPQRVRYEVASHQAQVLMASRPSIPDSTPQTLFLLGALSSSFALLRGIKPAPRVGAHDGSRSILRHSPSGRMTLQWMPTLYQCSRCRNFQLSPLSITPLNALKSAKLELRAQQRLDRGPIRRRAWFFP